MSTSTLQPSLVFRLLTGSSAGTESESKREEARAWSGSFLKEKLRQIPADHKFNIELDQAKASYSETVSAIEKWDSKLDSTYKFIAAFAAAMVGAAKVFGDGYMFVLGLSLSFLALGFVFCLIGTFAVERPTPIEANSLLEDATKPLQLGSDEQESETRKRDSENSQRARLAVSLFCASAAADEIAFNKASCHARAILLGAVPGILLSIAWLLSLPFAPTKSTPTQPSSHSSPTGILESHPHV